MDWVYTLSWPRLALLVLSLAAAISVFCLVVVRKFGSLFHFHDATDFGEIFYDAIGVVFALLLAFMAIAGWQDYNATSDTVDKEAGAILNIYRNVESFRSEVRDPIRNAIVAYVNSIIHEEWPGLVKAQQNPHTHQLLNDLSHLITSLKPANINEQIMMAELASNLTEYRSCRHDRLIASEPNLSPSMWFALYADTAIIILFACLFPVPSFRIHLVMILALALSLGLVFFLLIAYNLSFGAAAGIDSGPFQALLQLWQMP